MDNFASLLQDAREHAGLTQKELAERIGIDPSYISRIERGLSAPPVRAKVEAIAEALDITEPVQRALFFLAAGCAAMADFSDVPAEQVPQEIRPLLANSWPTANRLYPNWPPDPQTEIAVHDVREVIAKAGEHQHEVKRLVWSFLGLIRNAGTHQAETVDLAQLFVSVLRDAEEHQAEVYNLTRSFLEWLRFRYDIR